MTVRRAALLAALATGCGGPSRPAASADSAGAAAPPPGAAPAPGAATTGAAPAGRATMGPNGCVHDGRWRLCSFVDRLEHAGLVLHAERDSVRYDFLSVAGTRYTVNHGEIQAFVYDDSARLARDVARLDTVHVSPVGTLRHWDVRPTFVRSGNLAVVLLTLNEHLVERVQLAVGGGAPLADPDAPPVAQPLPPTRAR